jgi:hypothetical protein
VKARGTFSAEHSVVSRYGDRIVGAIDIAGESAPVSVQNSLVVVADAVRGIFKELPAVFLAVNVVDLAGPAPRYSNGRTNPCSRQS